MKKLFLWLITFSWAAYTWHLTTIPDFHPSPDTLISFLLSNGGHFVFFGVLAILLKLCLATYDNFMTKYLPLILTSLYGIIIEFVQLNIPGRSFSLEDWALDILGALAFLYIMRKYPHYEYK